MRLEVLPDADSAARRAAEIVAAAAREAIRARGRFNLALSGGHTPDGMLTLLADADIEWPAVSVYQVDERIAPRGDPARNLTQLQSRLLDRIAVPPRFLPMPVDVPDPAAAAEHYAASLPAEFDLVHLGLGADGHIASLVPGDPVLDAAARVAVTGEYGHHRRMTLTYPVLNTASRILYLVTGEAKRHALHELLAGTGTTPSAGVRRDHATVVADREAKG